MNWICLLIDSTFYNKGRDVLEGELTKIFGEDMCEFEVILSEEHDIETYYTMVKCSNYSDHKKKIVSSRAITGVINNYDNPAYLTDDEVRSYVDSVNYRISEEDDSPDKYRYGDIVKITSGYLVDLTGLVVKDNGKGCTVAFRLHTRSFTEDLKYSCFDFKGSLYERIKKPLGDLCNT